MLANTNMVPENPPADSSLLYKKEASKKTAYQINGLYFYWFARMNKLFISLFIHSLLFSSAETLLI